MTLSYQTCAPAGRCKTARNLVPGLYGSLDRAAGAERHVPLDRVRKVVKLPEVYTVDPHAVERALQLIPGARR